jgi:hypothetical protein
MSTLFIRLLINTYVYILIPILHILLVVLKCIHFDYRKQSAFLHPAHDNSISLPLEETPHICLTQ